MKRKTREEKAITLIALIITIVVLLILAVVAINAVTGDGIIQHAVNAKTEYEKAQDKERDMLAYYEGVLQSGEVVTTVEQLQENYKFEYYDSLSDAIKKVNGETVETVSKENAVAGIYQTDGKTSVVLLKDTTETATIQPNKDVTINLGGKTLTVNGPSAIEGMTDHTDTIIIDGRLGGSSIVVNGTSEGACVFQTRTNTFIINSGNYVASYNGKLTQSMTLVLGCYAESGGKLIMTNCKIEASSESDATLDNRLSVRGVICVADTQLTNCEIKAYSDYRVENSKYTSMSIGVYNAANCILKNCNVIGTQAGIDNHGNLYVDGGIYESYAHGGIYFASNTDDAYVCNAVIRECEMPQGYTTLNCTPGYTGFYIGGSASAKNISVYMDNCDLYATYWAFVLRGTSNEENNTLYISNSKIYGGMEIRIDNSTHRVYIGDNCNFTASNAISRSEDIEDFTNIVIRKEGEVYRR